ncbi:sensor histidine kinase [Sphingosinicella terrae]|uniref:sensor histidine kinase n=1 Tax=Sphingosinicella terrae TaxID=2172047 RepID=UPI000E0E0906|nr:ATP-binding protein [Sphingosinicella terrae]
MAEARSILLPTAVPAPPLPAMEAEGELLHLIDEGCLVLDARFRVLEVNAPALRLTGQRRVDIVGRAVWDLAPDLRHGVAGKAWVQAMRQRVPVSTRHLHSWRDGRETWLEMRAHPAGDGLVIFFRDISAEKSRQEALDRTRADLVHTSRIVSAGEMTGALAHELAQPLTSASVAVAAGLALLGRDREADLETARESLEIARSSLQRMGELLKRVRAYVAKNSIRSIQKLDVILSDAAILIQPQARLAEVEIAFDLDRHAIWVDADSAQIQQVVVQFVAHAIEAMAEGPDRKILVSARLTDSAEVEVGIEDSGPGAKHAPETLFVRAGDGVESGVGLAVCRTIVHAHGGRMRAGRSPAGGASFRFTLPCASRSR